MENKHQVWIIDDEEELTDIYSGFLDQTFKTRTFNSAKAALLAIEEEHSTPHLILSDIKMPEMDGLSFIEALRQKGADIPTILISGQLEKHHFLRSIPLNISGFLEKPCDPFYLEEQVRKTIFDYEVKRAESKTLEYAFELVTHQQELCSLYYERCALAENALLAKNIDLFPDFEAKSRHLSSQKRENSLNREIETILKKIHTLTQKFSN